MLALGTERNAAVLDCAPAAIRVANAGIPWSNAGRTGSAGRYAIDPNLDTPVFASAVEVHEAAGRDPGANGGTLAHGHAGAAACASRLRPAGSPPRG